MIKRIWEAILELNWSIVGALFVIITLSGSVKDSAILITALGVAVSLTALAIKEDKEE
jgi:hypothetical protein